MMTVSLPAYAVGRGRPPLHTRFKKGQSGNPSGKPGPARLAKQRFQRALFAALEGGEAELVQSKPESILTGVAKRIALDAAAGRMQAVRLLLSLLDAECRKAEAAEAETVEQQAREAEALSLVEGKTQGNANICLEDILWPGEPDWLDGGRHNAPAGTAPVSAPTRNEAEPLSLLQGKTQGNEKIIAEQIFTAQECRKLQTDARTGVHPGMAFAHDRTPLGEPANVSLATLWPAAETNSPFGG